MTHISGDVWERAQRLKEKMRANLTMAKDRLEVLGEYFPPWIFLFYKNILVLR